MRILNRSTAVHRALKSRICCRGAREILDLICVMKPRQVVYVSCDPPTLSRDLQFLAMRHYRLEGVQPLDMFPQTYHIESVAKLVRKNGA